jgi:hypothetical protein
MCNIVYYYIGINLLTKLSGLVSIGIYDAFVLCIELNMLCVYKNFFFQASKYNVGKDSAKCP